MLPLQLAVAGWTRVFGRELRWSRIGRHLRVRRWPHIRWLRIEDRLRNQVGSGRLRRGDRPARTGQTSVGIEHVRDMPAQGLRETITSVDVLSSTGLEDRPLPVGQVLRVRHLDGPRRRKPASHSRRSWRQALSKPGFGARAVPEHGTCVIAARVEPGHGSPPQAPGDASRADAAEVARLVSPRAAWATSRRCAG